MPKACSDLCFFVAVQVSYKFGMIVLRITKMTSNWEA